MSDEDLEHLSRDELLELGYRVTTFEHRPAQADWRGVVGCVVGGASSGGGICSEIIPHIRTRSRWRATKAITIPPRASEQSETAIEAHGLTARFGSFSERWYVMNPATRTSRSA